ncbi:MAG: right-handed parallel beta-helix repeat-containing protein, partial [Candidatus Omnitrophica bacterium]|nr:right-handed parallel beta-helix repeat-containing protein [Candidatus Omnitrophota bacterium]
MQKLLKYGCAIVLFSLAVLPCFSATYYVANQDSRAADTNAGTEDAPFKTISAAVAKVQLGDSVIVKNGTYRESVIWDKLTWDSVKGIPRTARTTLEAFPSHRPVIKGSEIVPAKWQPVRVALRQKVKDPVSQSEYDPSEWLRVIGAAGPRAAQPLPAGEGDDQALDNSKAPFVGIYVCPWETYSTLVFVDEVPLKQVGLQGSPERARDEKYFALIKQWDGKDIHDMRPGTFYYDEKGKKLYVWLADSGNPSERTIEASARIKGVILTGTWTVSGIDVMHVQDGSQTTCNTALVAQGKNIIVENCRILHNGFIGLQIHTDDGVIRNNEIAYNGLCGFTDSVGWRVLIERNIIHDNNWTEGVLCGHWSTKIVQWKDVRILKNHFYNETCGLWFDINVNNILVAENLFENLSTAVFFEISRWGVIANNIFRNCGRGVMSFSSDALI